MVALKNDYSGKTFGSFTILRFDGREKGVAMWECRCVCGTLKRMTAHNAKKTQSCGCLNRHLTVAQNNQETGMKRCSSCKIIKALDNFQKQAQQILGLRSHCKDCRKQQNELTKEERSRKSKENRRRNLAEHKTRSRFNRFGITGEQYEYFLRIQGNKCAICKASDAGANRDWATDHDHACCPDKTKRCCGECVRGLLCGLCNMGLGAARDNIEILEAMIDYLKTSKERREQFKYFTSTTGIK